MKDPHNTIRSH